MAACSSLAVPRNVLGNKLFRQVPASYQARPNLHLLQGRLDLRRLGAVCREVRRKGIRSNPNFPARSTVRVAL
jgi:hypothetical protein